MPKIIIGSAIILMKFFRTRDPTIIYQSLVAKSSACQKQTLFLCPNSKSNLHFIGGVHMAYTSHIEQIFADLAFERHLAKLAEAKAKYDALKKVKEAK